MTSHAGWADADETKSTQSDETTPYMPDSDQESNYDDDFSAGTTDLVDQQKSYTTKSDRAIKMPKYLKTSNYNYKFKHSQEQSSTANWTASYVLLLLKKGQKNRLNFVFVCKFYLAILSALLTLFFFAL